MQNENTQIKNIKKLKILIDQNKDKIFKEFPKKDSKEYLFISSELKNLYYFLFDLENLKLECLESSCKFDFYILAQAKDKKIYNYTQIIGEYDKIYFYPFLKELLQDIDKDDVVTKAFVEYKKNQEFFS